VKFREALKTWLLFDACLAAFLFLTLGVEGMAALACEFIDHENCQYVEKR
jgi:hypothetical protein